MANSKHSGWILGSIIFVMGGCGLAYEYTFSKIASDLLGNSVQQWAIVIAIMLFCMGIGAEIQRFVSAKKVMQLLIYSQLTLALVGGFGPFLLLYSFGYFPHMFGLAHYGIVSLMGVIIGFEIPLITRINEDYSDDIRSNLARVLKMDYVGALAGALVWVFVLPKFFNLHQIAYILGFISLIATIICWWFFRSRMKSKTLALTGFVLVASLLGLGLTKSEQWAFHAEQKLFRDRIIFTETTPYQHIVLTQSNYGTMRCYINGHIQFSSSDEYIYHENLVHPVMGLVADPKRILVLGGGDGLAVREVLKYSTVEEIVLVDLDPAMTDLAASHPLFTKLNDRSLRSPKVNRKKTKGISAGNTYELQIPNQRRLEYEDTLNEPPSLTILNIDAATYAKTVEGLFDVIICDFPDPSSPELAKLYSLHFYAELKKLLSPDGYLIQQSTSPYRAKEAFLCIGRTMNQAGFSTVPYHDHVPSFGEWGWWIASHRSIRSATQIKQNLKQISQLPDNIRYLTPELIFSNLSFGKEMLITSEDDITTTSHSAILNHYLNGWLD